MKELHKQWMGILIRGFFALLFGIMAIIWPGLGLQVLVIIFGAYAFVDGFIAFIVGSQSKSFALILEGIVGILVGVFIFFYTQQAAEVFMIVVGIWALVTGLFEVFAAVELRKYIQNEIWLMFVGIVSIVFGFLVFINPLIAGMAVTVVIGIYAAIFGLALIALAMKVKSYSPAKKRK